MEGSYVGQICARELYQAICQVLQKKPMEIFWLLGENRKGPLRLWSGRWCERAWEDPGEPPLFWMVNVGLEGSASFLYLQVILKLGPHSALHLSNSAVAFPGLKPAIKKLKYTGDISVERSVIVVSVSRVNGHIVLFFGTVRWSPGLGCPAQLSTDLKSFQLPAVPCSGCNHGLMVLYQHIVMRTNSHRLLPLLTLLQNVNYKGPYGYQKIKERWVMSWCCCVGYIF